MDPYIPEKRGRAPQTPVTLAVTYHDKETILPSLTWEFSKVGVPHFGFLIRRILLFRV